jgi:hypothetical protein
MSRKKTILLYCEDEQERAVLSTLFWVRYYKVIGGLSAEPPIPDLAVVVDTRSHSTGKMAKAIKEFLPSIPMLVILDDNRNALPDGYPLDVELLPARTLPIMLLERLRVLLKRKHHPLKGLPREVAA